MVARGRLPQDAQQAVDVLLARFRFGTRWKPAPRTDREISRSELGTRRSVRGRHFPGRAVAIDAAPDPVVAGVPTGIDHHLSLTLPPTHPGPLPRGRRGSEKTMGNRQFISRQNRGHDADVLRACLCGAGAGALNGCRWCSRARSPRMPRPRIGSSWVLELSEATTASIRWCPMATDAYYRHRPRIGIRPDKLRQDRRSASVSIRNGRLRRPLQGRQDGGGARCGYAQPSFSHFTSMAYCHTGAPNRRRGNRLVGRLADAIDTQPRRISSSTSTRRSRWL